MRLNPSSGLRRSIFGATGTATTPAFWRRLASTPVAAAAATGMHATPRIAALANVVAAAAAAVEIALPARPPKRGAIATTQSAPAAKDRFAPSSLDRAMLPSLLAFASRRGVASNGLSDASLMESKESEPVRVRQQAGRKAPSRRALRRTQAGMRA